MVKQSLEKQLITKQGHNELILTLLVLIPADLDLFDGELQELWGISS